MKGSKPDIPVLEELIDATVALFHLLQEFTARTHRDVEITAGKRGVLRSLKKGGPQTVPHMARARPVSRQCIQTVANQLEQAGLVETRPNPAHKRSQLVALTPAGEALLDRIISEDQEIFAQLPLPADTAEIQCAANVLKEVRAAFAAYLSQQPPHKTERRSPC